MNGLVVARRMPSLISHEKQNKSQCNKNVLVTVEALVQKAAVDPKWREWLEDMAAHCYISPFRMLKAALPPGWLGQSKLPNLEAKSIWWVTLEKVFSDDSPLTSRQ